MASLLYQHQKGLVIGLGLSGRAAARFLIQHGACVQGVDSNQTLLTNDPEIQELKQLGLTTNCDQESLNVTLFDFVVVSPGIPYSHPLYVAAQKAKVQIWGEIELGCRTVNNPLIGITGTNGKTTVTLLVTHVLNQTGRKARALGNVGKPLTQELASLQKDEILVLELSSYQIETLYQKVFDVAVLLNITPDHLDRYSSMQAYAQAKLDLQRCLKPNCPFYMEDQAFKNYGQKLDGPTIRRYGYTSDCWLSTDLTSLWIEGKKVCDLENAFQGKVSHDVENLMAAYAVCQHFGVKPLEFMNAIKSFKKPAHRIEFIREKEGIYYYDDSKGTNIDAVVRAVQSLPGQVILIAGGVDKGAPYTPWLTIFANKVKMICAIGQAADKMQHQLSHQVPVKIFKTLDQAVRYASTLAQRGDNVLLSPGCSSFDMFRDYAHRGEEFQRAVHQL